MQVLANVKNVLSYLSIGWAVLREVKELVEVVEEADVEDGKAHGKEKKAAVLELIEAVYDAGENTIGMPVEKETVLELADSAVDVFVNLFNVIGRFRSKSE